MAAAAELTLLEKSLGLSKGNKYSAQGERQIPVLQTNSGPCLTGLATIAAHLVKEANKDYLLGSTAEEKAIVQQWLEYRVTRVDGNSSKDDIRILLKDLNSYLEDKVYLTGYNFTLADILLYYGLHRFIRPRLFLPHPGWAAIEPVCASALLACDARTTPPRSEDRRET
ncbi:PREDICTED: eukaryotic translation elongation factor 1 epsilon-1 isoform X2 [Miniopterus natalensis]|uniref:eukaryotic translation elongation factor 1 epsilon-1 isoform X2 n=1 Tax=Miniopterus natalensis TaxID=291302 RepID=UPI0007A6C65E|nr:PREDICTED: eukaryotic translation elongation factor 1 epsilon-1 isoform X2 [Miniopterus natalensis]